MTTRHDCKFCNNTFVTLAILERHQKTAKYCLKIQGREALFKT